jgi:hypothetical protein
MIWNVTNYCFQRIHVERIIVEKYEKSSDTRHFSTFHRNFQSFYETKEREKNHKKIMCFDDMSEKCKETLELLYKNEKERDEKVSCEFQLEIMETYLSQKKMEKREKKMKLRERKESVKFSCSAFFTFSYIVSIGSFTYLKANFSFFSPILRFIPFFFSYHRDVNSQN